MKITPEAVKERIAALESAGKISLKEQFYLEALRLLVAGMDGSPEGNGVKFCPKCGKSVAVSATEGTEE